MIGSGGEGRERMDGRLAWDGAMERRGDAQVIIVGRGVRWLPT